MMIGFLSTFIIQLTKIVCKFLSQPLNLIVTLSYAVLNQTLHKKNLSVQVFLLNQQNKKAFCIIALELMGREF